MANDGDSQSAKEFLRQGQTHLRSGNLLAARDEYRRAEKLDQEEASAGFERVGLLAAKHGDFVLAEEALERAFQLGRRSDATLYYLGWSSLQTRNLKKCIQAWSLLSNRLGDSDSVGGRVQGQLEEVVRLLESNSLPLKAQGDRPDLTSLNDVTRIAASISESEAVDAVANLNGPIAEELAVALATMFVVSSRRQAALAVLEDYQRREPICAPVAHSLFVTSFFNDKAESTKASRTDVGSLDESDERTIRNTVLLLTNETFWNEWTEQRYQAYQIPTGESDLAGEVRARLERFLLKSWSLDSAMGASFRIELEGARAVESVGGLASVDSHTSLCPGRLFVTHLGYQIEVAELFRDDLELRMQQRQEQQFADFRFALLVGGEFDFDSTRLDATGDLCGARWFSRLAGPQMLIEYGRPELALDLLRESACPDCQTSAPTDDLPFRICLPACDNLLEENPGFALLEDPYQQLHQSAALLWCKAHLELAGRPLTSHPPNIDECTVHWQAALDLARRMDLDSHIEENIGERVLGRAVSLHDKRNHDEAIEVLEGAHQILEGPLKKEVSRKLADAFFIRAAATSHTSEGKDENECRDIWARVENDLRRSFEFNRTTLQVLRDFPQVLMQNCDLFSERDPIIASRQLMEAWEVWDYGINQFPEDEQLQIMRRRLLMKLSDVLRRLIRSNRDSGESYSKAYEYCSAVDDIMHCDARLRAEAQRLTWRDTRICEVAIGAVFELMGQDKHFEANQIALDVLERYSGAAASLPLHLVLGPLQGRM